MNAKLVVKTTSGKNPLKTLSAFVSKAIIQTSERCNKNLCMVAQALQEKYPTATYIDMIFRAIRVIHVTYTRTIHLKG